MCRLTIVFYDGTSTHVQAASYRYDKTFLWVRVADESPQKHLGFSLRLIASVVVTENECDDDKEST